MPVSLALLMAVTAALLAVAVCAVLWGTKRASKAATAPSEAPRPAPVPVAPPLIAPEADAPSAASLWTTQLEVGQTFHIQTRSAKYALTLRDPMTGLYDAVRVGPRRGQVVHERFTMLFKGTFVPYRGFLHREFAQDGNLYYEMLVDGGVRQRTSTPVTRILFTVGESLRQAS